MPSIIVFSKDRPMQLHAYLESLLQFTNVKPVDITVLYYHNPQIDYSLVRKLFPTVNWVRETNFHLDLSNAIDGAEKYIMFGCDDVVFTSAFNLDLAEEIMQKDEAIFGFSFRLGTNIRPLPNNLSTDKRIIKWDWGESSELHYNYPWELDCTLYRKVDVLDILHCHGIEVKSPNYLEGDIAQDSRKYIEKQKMACFNEKSKAIVITVNRVQDTHCNSIDDTKNTDIHTLSTLYNKTNMRLNIKRISRIGNKHIHVGAKYFILNKVNPPRTGRHPIVMFLKNIGHLFKYDLKTIAKYKGDELVTERKLNLILDGIKYELADDLKNLTRPNIAPPDITIAKLASESASICRFGDGEFMLIEGLDIPFQKFDPVLSSRLKDVLQSNVKEILIGIPYCYYSSLATMRPFQRDFMRSWVAKNRDKISELTHPDRQYYDTGCTQMYAMYESMDFKAYFDSIRKLWRERDIVIICGKTIFDQINENIFDCASSVEFQYAPSTNAFENYDEILRSAKNITKSKLIIVILGPTATVLAYDLALAGYQALDMGHIAKDYDYYCKAVAHSNQTIADFYKPD